MNLGIRENKAITLIALIITIIVLLILAGVTIATLTGDNGILKQAQNAKELTYKASVEEMVKIEVSGSYDEKGNLDAKTVTSNIEKNIDEATVEGEDFPLTVTVDGNKFIIEENGSIRKNVINPYNKDGWTYASICIEGQWANHMFTPEEIEPMIEEWKALEETEGTIIAKFYKQNYTVTPPQFYSAQLPQGDAYHLVIEGSGMMGSLVDVEWCKEAQEFIANGTGTPIISYVTEAYLCDGIENLGDCCLSFAMSLNKIAIGNTITSIGNNGMVGCISLENITIPNTITSIGEGTFNSCLNLKSVTVPNTVESIENGTFVACKSLESITIPSSVITIGNAAFSECNNLKSITIPNSVTSIGDEAFYECSKLTSITIPNSVTNIGSRIFALCGVKTVNYKGTKEEWEKLIEGINWNGAYSLEKIICTNGEIILN